jgi:uncharacterized damage-inducible protein DinB
MTLSREIVAAMRGHAEHANGKLLDAAARLDPEELRKPVDGAAGSILDILLHMMASQMAWTRRFRELDPIAPPAVEEFATVADLRERWQQYDADTRACLDAFSDEDLEQVIHFRSWYGWESSSPRWQAVLHEAFHQHQHRGEVAMALTALGSSPGEIDVFDYIDETYVTRPPNR